MDEDEIIVTSPTTIIRSSPPVENSVQQHEEPNGQPERGAKPTRPIKLAKNYNPHTANNDELEDDLEDFGFDQGQVKNLLTKRESRFDATMQRPHLQTREDRENERRRLLGGSGSKRLNELKPTSGVRREGQRPAKKVKRISGEGLVIEGTGSKFRSPEYILGGLAYMCLTDWILFDPNSHDFPLRNGKEPPALFQKYMRYEPGNIRILEYNPTSECVRLKTTPASLRGKIITYTSEGPKIGLKLKIEIPPAQPQAQPQAPPAPPKRRGGPGRPKGRGGRGGRGGAVGGAVGGASIRSPAGSTARRGDVSKGSMRTRATTTARAPRKSEAIVKEESEGDSGSESPLTDIEASMEVGDSQEGDSTSTSLS